MKILNIAWNKSTTDHDTGDNYWWYEESFFLVGLEKNFRWSISKVRHDSIPYNTLTIAWFKFCFGKRGQWTYVEQTAHQEKEHTQVGFSSQRLMGQKTNIFGVAKT